MADDMNVSAESVLSKEQALQQYVDALARTLASGVERHMIRVLGDLQKLELKAGDRCVLMSRDPISATAHRSIQEHWKEFAGPDVALMILDAGMRLGVISKGDAE